MRMECFLERFEINSRLDAHKLLLSVEFKNLVEVGWKRHDNTFADRRSRQVSTATACSDRQNMALFGKLPRKTSNFTDIVCCSWVDD